MFFTSHFQANITNEISKPNFSVNGESKIKTLLIDDYITAFLNTRLILAAFKDRKGPNFQNLKLFR